MDKYISRDAIRNTLYEADAITMKGVAILNQFPAADVVEVRHGWWHDVYMSGASSFVGTCSICGKSNDIPPVPLAKYCPNCGAKMEGWKWCVWQDEDNEGVYCTAHIHEDRVLNCPYKDLEERQRADYPCQDYRPIDGGQDDV